MIKNYGKRDSLEKLFSEIILFFIRNKFLIISITIGVVSVILFQKLFWHFLRPLLFSLLLELLYERFEDDDILNQRTAINMINNLQLDIRKEDYNALSKKLNLNLEESSGIKYIVL